MKVWTKMMMAAWVMAPSVAAWAAGTGTPVDVASRFLFVPTGFDNNDQVEVVLDGFLPNACYKVAEPRISFDEGTKKFQVVAVAHYFAADETVCGTYEVPFTVTAKLGQVPTGDYTVKTFGGPEKPLHIKQSNSVGPDDFLYAPVEHVHVMVDMRGRNITAAIEGRFTDSCMRFSEVKVLDEGENIVLLPVISMEQRNDCHAQNMRYKPIEAKIPWRQPGRYLLHVRGLSGVAVNQVFEIDAVSM